MTRTSQKTAARVISALCALVLLISLPLFSVSAAEIPMGRNQYGEEADAVLRIVSKDDGGGSLFGHSFLIITSLRDGLELNFKDIYKYNELRPEYRTKVLENPELLSWRSYPGLSQEERDAKTAEILNTLCVNGPVSVTLNKGESLTVSAITFADWPHTFGDALFKGRAAPILGAGAVAAACLIDYGATSDPDLLRYAVYGGAGLIGSAAGVLLFNSDLIDGVTDGGICLNQELYFQLDEEYDLYPNAVAGTYVTQRQLNDAVSYIDGINHYNVINQNCTTCTVNAWNEAVGYERGEDGCWLYDEEGERIPSMYHLERRDDSFLMSRVDFPGTALKEVRALGERLPADALVILEDPAPIVMAD